MWFRTALLLACAGAVFAQRQPLERAWGLAANGHRAEAIALLQQITVSDPQNADARLLLGSLLMEAGDKKESIEQLSAAVRLGPRSVEAENALGEAYNHFGQTAAARSAFEKAVAIDPGYGIAQSNLGQVLLQQGDFVGAAAHLDRAIALLNNTDDAADAQYLRAKVCIAQNQPAQAIEHLQRAVAIRPKFAEAWSDLGQERKILLDDRAAITALKQAVAANPNDPVAQYRLGAEYLHQGKAHESVAHLRKSYELNPKDQSTLNALQGALRQDGDTDGANHIKLQLAQLLRERDRINQNKLAAVRLNNEGAALEKSGDLRAAVTKYREASQLDPDHNGIRINYGVALLRLGQWTEGLNQLHVALQHDPDNAKLRKALKEALAQAPAAAQPAWHNEVQ